MRHPSWILPALSLGAIAFLAGCSTDRSTSFRSTAPTSPLKAVAAPEPPGYPGADAFVSGLSNPYLGFRRGRTFTYESPTKDGLETIVVEVTRNTKTILGVVTTVVRDRVYLDGELIEDTFDWYAQDEDGNVWYFGEDSKTYENGVLVSTDGSWEAGVDGAMPGIVMLADPQVGMTYRQEVAPGVAEDMAKVVSLSGAGETPYTGAFSGALVTLEWSPITTGPKENKYYVSGVGLVLETGAGKERVELLSVTN